MSTESVGWFVIEGSGYLGKSSGFVSTVVSVQHLLHLLSSLQEFLSGFTFTPLTILGG
jgi:hypothetical protein